MRTLRRALPAFLAPFPGAKRLPSARSKHISKPRFLSCSFETAPVTTRVRLPTPRETEQLGRLLALSVTPGSVILLHGDLGAGKTSFARGFVRAAVQDDSVEVTSPTFLLANEYPVPPESADKKQLKVFHMDLWRLKDASSRSIVDFEDVFENHVSLIEWPDRLQGMTPRRRLDVTLEYVDAPVTDSNPWGFADADGDSDAADARVAALVPRGSLWEERVALLADKLRALEQETPDA